MQNTYSPNTNAPVFINSPSTVASGVSGLWATPGGGDTPTNSRIRDGITYLESQMSELHSLLSALESRLDTALTPVPPQPASVNGVKDPNAPASHVGIRLDSLSNGVSEAQVRVRSLLSRIEI